MKKIYTLFAALGALGVSTFGKVFAQSSAPSAATPTETPKTEAPKEAPARRPQPRQMSEEQQKKLFEKFEKTLAFQNAERKAKFPKFQTFIVYGLEVVAFSQKNAHRDLTNMLKGHGMRIVERPAEAAKA